MIKSVVYIQKMRNWVSILGCLVEEKYSHNKFSLLLFWLPFSFVDRFSPMSTPHFGCRKNHPRFTVHKCHTLLSEIFSWSQAAPGTNFNVTGVFLNVATSSLKKGNWNMIFRISTVPATLFREATEKSALIFSTIRQWKNIKTISARTENTD